MASITNIFGYSNNLYVLSLCIFHDDKWHETSKRKAKRKSDKEDLPDIFLSAKNIDYIISLCKIKLE